jgi:hemerythrin-like domain-containing protein
MSTTIGAKPDTRDMVIVHRLFRREFRLMPDLVANVAVGDVGRATVVADHATDVVTALHNHHETEDELLWPVLLAKAAPHSELVHRMEAQHTAMGDALVEMERLLPIWRSTARAADRDALAEALRTVSEILDEHLAEEEREILPLAEQFMTVEEWEALGQRGAEKMDKEKRMLFLGAVLEDTTPQERDEFLRQLPLPGRLLWQLLGRRGYAAYVRKVRGSAS